MFERFSLNPSVILRSEPQYYETYVAFDYERVATEFLDADEIRALEYVYRSPAGLREISREAGMEYRKCVNFMRYMMRLGYVKNWSAGSSRKIPVRTRIDLRSFDSFHVPFLSSPTSIDIFITNRCNLNCVHCFSGSKQNGLQELSLEDLRSVFSQSESMGVFEVRINGGEPLLHRKINEILLLLKGKRFRKVVITNGTLFDENIALLMKDAGIIPTVSIDDSEEMTHDLFRGAGGSFKRTIEALGILQKHNVQYGINCCLHKRNFCKCEDLVNLATKYGANRIAFLDLKPVGRMKENLEFLPSYEEYLEVMKNLEALRTKTAKIDVSLDAFLCCHPLKESVLEAQKGYVSCQAGKTRMSIDSEGSVYPCNIVISDPLWEIGNIKSQKLLNIWFSQKWGFFRGGVKLNDLEECKDCGNLRECKDFFCRLLPYAVYGDPFVASPKCKSDNLK